MLAAASKSLLLGLNLDIERQIDHWLRGLGDIAAFITLPFALEVEFEQIAQL